ncbi:MAG: helix-turn-helix transcriptional regulator [Bauldia sp.]
MAEPLFLTTKELATLLRVKERKVYDMVAEGSVPHRRVTGKLLFPKDEIERWLQESPGTTPPPVYKSSAQALQVVAGAQDPLLEWALRESGSGLAALFDDSYDGVERLKAREAVAACLHVYDPATSDWNVGFVAARFAHEPVALLSFARRSRGLLLAPNNPLKIRSIADLAGKRVAIREDRAGRALAEHFLSTAGLSPKDVKITGLTSRSETDAAVALLSGNVDAAIGLKAVAEQFRLGYLAEVEEQYDILVFRRAYFEPPLQKLFAFCRTQAFRDHAAKLSGYDLSDLGEVRFNGL